ARGGDRRPRAGRDRSRARPARRAAAAAGEVPAAAAAGAVGADRDRPGRAGANGSGRLALALPRRARWPAAGQRRGRGGMNSTWKQRREGGGWFAIWLIRGIGRYGGRALARLFLYPITAYFLLRRTDERRDSRASLTRILGRPATLGDVARHIHTFAATILDRVFLLGGEIERFDITVHGVAQIHDQLDRGRGALLFGSHLRSFDVLRVIARQRPDSRIALVLDK